MIQNELNASFKFMELLSTLLWEPACSSLAATKPTRTEILKIKNHFDKSLFFFLQDAVSQAVAIVIAQHIDLLYTSCQPHLKKNDCTPIEPHKKNSQ